MYFDIYTEQKQPPEVFCNKGALRNFAKFTGKHLCQSLFSNKVEKLNNRSRFNSKVLVSSLNENTRRRRFSDRFFTATASGCFYILQQMDKHILFS